MSKEFKIANWKVEVDWRGMTLEPVETPARQAGRKRRKPVPQGRKAAVAVNLQRKKITEQGESQAWL
jgi:hypothetical protein